MEKEPSIHFQRAGKEDSGTEKEEQKRKRRDFVEGEELDLAFALDCTGSMSSYIRSATESIQDIARKLVQSEKANVNFALIAYRDHPPQDQTYATRVYPFTNNLKTVKGYLSSQTAAGGGDGPECVTAALHAALHLPWRENATKILVIIADAPPHGLGEKGDGFPNGDPNGHDPIQIVNQMRADGITIFSVACEPTLSTYGHAVDFFDFCATATGGTLIPLTSASLLPDVIVGGAQEQMKLEQLLAQFKVDAEKAKAAGAKTEEDISRYVHKEWSKKGVKTPQMTSNAFYSAEWGDRRQHNVSQYMSSPTLASARKSTVAIADRGSPSISMTVGDAPDIAPRSKGPFGGSSTFKSLMRSAPTAPGSPPPVTKHKAIVPPSPRPRMSGRSAPEPAPLYGPVPHGMGSIETATMATPQRVTVQRDTISFAQIARLHQQSVSRTPKRANQE
ncbi:hypothetical protein HDV00_012185 [Rhizophlyctis rosea]|nr:hypothetical protein HDV00_012185 [Rhizophlyctis rosea]